MKNIMKSVVASVCGALSLSLLASGVCLAQATPKSQLRPNRVLHVSVVPLAGVAPESQFRSIGEAAKIVGPGDRVLIHSGTYRESVVIEKSGTKERPIRFETVTAANVMVTGADRLTEWRKEGGEGENIFSAEWPHSFGDSQRPHPGDDFHHLVGRAEQVFVHDYPLQQVLSRDRLERGTFFADLENKRLYAWNSSNENLRALRVEASVRPVLWACAGDYVQVRGVRFRYAANRAQEAAAQFTGRGDVVEDCVFERTNSIGATFRNRDQTARRCTFQDNGQMGWSAGYAHNMLMSECLTRNNNTKNFNRGWEAGADKIVLTRGMVIEKSRFEDNRGSGIWFDIGNENCTVRNCLIANNQDAGIFYEISYGLHLHDCVIIGNGLAETPGAWGAACGVSLSSSPNCIIERNLIIGNLEGFNFREQYRGTPLIDGAPGQKEVAVWNHDEIIRNNVLAYNRDAQVWGWFDVADEREWPAALQGNKAETAKATQDIAADYQAKDPSAQPVGLSLEKLKFTFANNLYSVQEGQPLFHWGTAWKRNKIYPTLDAVREELKLERGSVVARFVFGDYLTRDFRVPANSLALKMGAYPKGEVPGVRLGTLASSATRRAGS